jgi:DNA-binding helix-hairpin-helix protein with protein kinase domain
MPTLFLDFQTLELTNLPMTYPEMRAPVSDSGLLMYNHQDDPRMHVNPRQRRQTPQAFWARSTGPNAPALPAAEERVEYAACVYVQHINKGGVVISVNMQPRYIVLKSAWAADLIDLRDRKSTWTVGLRSHDVAGRGMGFPYRHVSSYVAFRR